MLVNLKVPCFMESKSVNDSSENCSRIIPTANDADGPIVQHGR